MVDSVSVQCPICLTLAAQGTSVDAHTDEGLQVSTGQEWLYWECPRCGLFYAERDFSLKAWQSDGVLGPRDSRKRANLSSWVRLRTDRGEEPPALARTFLDRGSDDNLRDQFSAIATPSVHEQADRLLIALGHETKNAGDVINTAAPNDVWLARSWAHSHREVNYILRYLTSRKLVSSAHNFDYMNEPNAPISAVVVAPDGWARLEQMERERQDSDQCFVAMAFNSNLRPLYDRALRPAIWAAGYRPLRIDDKHHANRISDEIEVEIKASKLIVADLTSDNYGAIYEMGFARGHGITTILTRLHTELSTKGHFDYKQINTIPWENLDDLEEFSVLLRNRIINLCGPGPARPEPEDLEELQKTFPYLFTS